MMMSKFKKVLSALALAVILFIPVTNVSAASKYEWVRDVYPNAWDYVYYKDGQGDSYTQVWTDSQNYFLVKCAKVEYGKCFVIR